MRTIHIYILCLCMCFTFGIQLNAQNTCGPEEAIDTSEFEGTAFFNYGCTTRSKTNSYKTALAIGQNFIGYTEDVKKSMTLGFYARYFLPPFALKVIATQGELLDRIQVTWEIDALGPSPNAGFNIYRDGIFLQTVTANIRSYNDFNVIAGRPYTYCVRGINIFGEGVAGCALGFQIPNGVVTGWISTLNGSPVPGASVMLTPMQGFSAKFENGDGAFSMADSLNPFLPADDKDWTIAFWIKTGESVNGKVIGMPGLFIRARPSSSGHEGIAVGITPGGTAFLTADFPDSTKNNWHHVALTYDGNSNKGRLYFDGILADISPMDTVSSPDTINIGELVANTGSWVGRLDELRIYHQRLDELDLPMVMEGTASSETPHLQYYWKMDEELGERSYDIVRRHKLYFCNAEFDPDRPPVHTAGITNEDGFYKIESASYGTGTTFLANPNKNFYMHRALKFDKAESDYATLPDFAITKKATIELWVNSAGPAGFQCLISKQFGTKEFRVVLDGSDGLNNYINVHLNGTTRSLTQPLGSGYQHLAFTWDSLSHTIKVFKNGEPLNTFNDFPATAGNWSDSTQLWHLGRRPVGASSVLSFDGLIDEVAVYDTTLSAAAIKDHFEKSLDMQEKGLRIYFPLDEGSGSRLNNVGSTLVVGGTTSGTEWSPLAAHQVIEPHIFTPNTRQVTLNPSVTSVDQVDFTDRSTIAVSGYVRYKNTDCFAGKIEMLVNGESYSPPIFTDSTGQFLIDFDPGVTAVLTPVFEDHVFVPASWEVINVTSPIAGILFNDITTRKVTGQVAGGTCKKSIITAPPGVDQGTFCRVRVSSVDGCFKRELTIDNQAGLFEFLNLPPLEKMVVAVVSHSTNPAIEEAFEALGGKNIDLSLRDTMVEFIYRAQPEVVIVDGLPQPYLPDCIDVVFDQYQEIDLEIRVREQYEPTTSDNGTCYLDTANFHIINGIGDEVVDTTMSDSVLIYTFIVGEPNPTPPFKKNLQIVATAIDGNDDETNVFEVVTGLRTKHTIFTSVLPETPSLILRDPPGDGSYSYLEKNEKFCQKISFTQEITLGEGAAFFTDIGPDHVVPTFFGAPNIEFQTIIGPNSSITTSVHTLGDNSIEVCSSSDDRISTGDGDLIVGGFQGGDVYVGGALNIEFGFADFVSFVNCEAVNTVSTIVVPGNYATTFMYSEWYIKNSVIYNLAQLAATAPDQDTKELYLESKARWESFLQQNKAQKASARFLKNISFDAGATYEYSETSDTTIYASSVLEAIVDLEADFNVLAYFFGVGGGFQLHSNFQSINGDGEEATNDKGITTGYVLKDDDPLDAYSIDVGMDSVYKTPVFNIQAGQSTCPWEYGTAKRQGMVLTPVDGPTRVDVPANEVASFDLIMGNTSATQETFTYAFTAGPESNKYSADIRCNGAPMNQVQWYAIPYTTSLPVEVTVGRGPDEYDYDSLEIVLYSFCEDQRANELGILPDTLKDLYSAVYLSVHFIRPCSEVDIHVPDQDWVVFPDPGTPGSDNTVLITVTGYDTSETNFKLARVQYRQAGGNGTWTNIDNTNGVYERYNRNWSGYDTLNPKPPFLQKLSTNFFWNTTGLEDGPYEIRALTECSDDASDKRGYSEIIKGRIDRQPPSLVGVPQPSDGVLHAGDEISFTFNQEINCNKLIQADMTNENNVGLYDVTTGKLIHANITCVDKMIVIDPIFINSEFENHILRAELDSIEDLTGNVLVEEEWQFYVDRNELAWLSNSGGITKYEDETKSISVKIHNRGGYPVPFTIQDIPDWVHVSPDAGTLVANEIRDIQFTAADTLALGLLSDSIVLRTESGENPFFMGGDEALPFTVRNICRPPDWQVNTGLYQLTMTMSIRVKINDDFSEDLEDQVAVFINGQLRGTAKLSLVQSTGNSIAFVTVYGNTSDIGKTLTYEIFDASACLHYPATLSGAAVIFQTNAVIGAPNSARALLATSSLVLQEIPVKMGWNWISFNLGFIPSTINNVLNKYTNQMNDLVKDQTTFATYTNGLWSGSLANINNTTAYQYQANQSNIIKVIGSPLTPASVQITVGAGWNWIGYIPTYKLPVNTALATLSASPNDVIKNQTGFAQYLNAQAGWVGNLKMLQPNQGYLLYLNTGGILTYPPQPPFTGDEHFNSREVESLSSFWNVDASQYEHNMTFIGIFQYDEMNATTGEMELGAFVGDELRGVGEAIYIEYLDAYMFFMTSFANTNGEQLHFKLYDSITGTIQNLHEKMEFIPNYHQGSIENPLPFTMQTSGMADVSSELSFNVQPNPFRDETVCRFELPDAQNVHLSITDMDGKNLYTTQIQAHAGLNSFTWKGCSTIDTPLSNGVYFIRLATEQGILTKKVVLQR